MDSPYLLCSPVTGHEVVCLKPLSDVVNEQTLSEVVACIGLKASTDFVIRLKLEDVTNLKKLIQAEANFEHSKKYSICLHKSKTFYWK